VTLVRPPKENLAPASEIQAEPKYRVGKDNMKISSLFVVTLLLLPSAGMGQEMAPAKDWST